MTSGATGVRKTWSAENGGSPSASLEEPEPVVPRVAAALERPRERLERVARERDEDEERRARDGRRGALSRRAPTAPDGTPPIGARFSLPPMRRTATGRDLALLTVAALAPPRRPAALTWSRADDASSWDVPLYQSFGDRMADGEVPYRDFRVEYPPGALPAFLLPSLVAPGERPGLRAGAERRRARVRARRSRRS